MSQFVTTGATLVCSFGTTPSTFNATSATTVLMSGKPVGTLTDGKAMVNIQSFGMCSSLANPTVAAATAAALGVLTPQPCIPATPGAWLPSKSMVIAKGKPCLTMECKCMCAYGGSVTIVNPGQALCLQT